MDDRGYDDLAADKQWASKYILGPLYDPEPSQLCATHASHLPTPPPPAGSTRRFFRQAHKTAGDSDEDQPLLRRVLSRKGSVRRKPIPPSAARSGPPPLSGSERRLLLHTANPPQTRWNQGTILSRNSLSTPRPHSDAMAPGDQAAPRRRAGSLSERYPGDRSHRPLETLTQEHRARDGPADTLPRRSASLRERYPGDMSHRPLAMIRQEHRAADRAPHLHNRRRQQPSDTIDTLDATGPVPGVTYHHEGPFDATLKERNRNQKYAPVEAVKDSNLEALKATPAEFVQDSLEKRVPLQGTAIIPPGMKDFGGRTMQYEEGADLMRDEDAPGGAYKRWDHIQYRDDDLKGKGEPAFSYDQARRAQASGPGGATVSYEMQPQPTPASGKKGGAAHVRHRSVSNGAERLPDADADAEDAAASSGLQRSNTTGKSLAQSLKRRLGSLKKKRPTEEVGY